MGPNSVLSKTQKGVLEIETRQNKLDARLRTLLITINGKATVAELVKQFEQIGDIAPMLQQLAAQGYVKEEAAGAGSSAAGGDLKAAQIELATWLRNALGPDADAITEKIEACKTAAEVRAYLDARRGTLDNWMGKAKSAQFWSKVDALLK